MVYKPLSKAIIKDINWKKKDDRMSKALTAYSAKKSRILAPGKTHRGLRPIAEEYQVSYSTLSQLANGGTSMTAFNAGKQKLTVSEEKVLVENVLLSAD